METLRRRAEQLAEHLLRHVLPLFAKDQLGRYRAVGTGFLIHFSGHHFLVTAAHVFLNLPRGAQIFFYVGADKVRTVEFPLLTTTQCANDPARDRLDLAVVPLKGSGLPPYPSVNKSSLPIEHLAAKALPREGKQFLITGFPSSKSQPHLVRRIIESAPYANWCRSSKESDYSRLGLAADIHIVMPFHQKRVFGKDGVATAFPSLKGMSGSPVWLLYDETGDYNRRSFTPLVGVLIEYHRANRLIVATDIAAVMSLLHNADP